MERKGFLFLGFFCSKMAVVMNPLVMPSMQFSAASLLAALVVQRKSE